MMISANKFLTISLIVLLLSSLLVFSIKPSDAQTASKPEVPQFNITFVPDNNSVEVSIKNQQFTPYTDELGRKCNLYYMVEVKGHLEENNWRTFSYQNYPDLQDRVRFIFPSESEYTVVSSGTHGTNSQLDLRVKAFAGYWVEPTPMDHLGGIHDPRLVEVESSDWSIQTITITHGQSWYLSRFFLFEVGLLLFACIVGIGTVLLIRKCHLKKQQQV